MFSHCQASIHINLTLLVFINTEKVKAIERFKQWWARWDSNPRPRDYESPALTTELQARCLYESIKHKSKDYALRNPISEMRKSMARKFDSYP